MKALKQRPEYETHLLLTSIYINKKIQGNLATKNEWQFKKYTLSVSCEQNFGANLSYINII